MKRNEKEKEMFSLFFVQAFTIPQNLKSMRNSQSFAMIQAVFLFFFQIFEENDKIFELGVVVFYLQTNIDFLISSFCQTFYQRKTFFLFSSNSKKKTFILSLKL